MHDKGPAGSDGAFMHGKEWWRGKAGTCRSETPVL